MSFMTYLTKFPVHVALARKPEKTQRWRVDDPEFRHRAVMGLFPDFGDNQARSRNNILFRYEFIPVQAPYFLVQSDCDVVAPDLEGVIETKQVEYPSYENGTPIIFRLALNTVTRRTIETNGRKREVITPVALQPLDAETGLNPAEKHVAYKLSTALQGIEFLNHNRQVLQVPKVSRALQIDTFDCTGVVTDSQALEHIMHAGIGRAKAYGCGLLTARRAA